MRSARIAKPTRCPDDKPDACGKWDSHAPTLTVAPSSAGQTAFYDDAVRQLNDALDARRNRIQTAVGGLPWDIAALILFSSFVVVASAVLVGSPSYWWHLLGPAAIAAVVVVSLVVLVDLSYPFSGDFAIPPDDFQTGVLEAFFTSILP